jgi:hypothetical protein
MKDDKDYTPSDAEKRVKELFDKWSFLVGDQGYTITIEYYDNHLDSDGMLNSEKTVMQCWPNWAYKYARIAVNIDAINLDNVKDRLEWTVVHELTHILQGECDYETAAMYERSASEFTSAILRASVRFIDAK